jgi:DNA-binding MarR family transcriptional regulator
MQWSSPPSDTDHADLSPVRTFGFRLWHVQHAWTRRLEASLDALDLTHMQYVVLRASDHLARQGEKPTQTRLAECLVTDRMMVSKVLRILEEKSYLVRPVHPDDSRANHVVLTETGRRVLSAAIEVAQRAQSVFFGRLGGARQQQLGAMLDDLLAMEGNPFFAATTVTTTTVDEGST